MARKLLLEHINVPASILLMCIAKKVVIVLWKKL